MGKQAAVAIAATMLWAVALLSTERLSADDAPQNLDNTSNSEGQSDSSIIGADGLRPKEVRHGNSSKTSLKRKKRGKGRRQKNRNKPKAADADNAKRGEDRSNSPRDDSSRNEKDSGQADDVLVSSAAPTTRDEDWKSATIAKKENENLVRETLVSLHTPQVKKATSTPVSQIPALLRVTNGGALPESSASQPSSDVDEQIVKISQKMEKFAASGVSIASSETMKEKAIALVGSNVHKKDPKEGVKYRQELEKYRQIFSGKDETDGHSIGHPESAVVLHS
ncbi:MAG: hypothetical protein LBS14_01360 [Holosporaceae bacterium]|nr:hypothetical protein [Holosporaceae bacterium]